MCPNGPQQLPNMIKIYSICNKCVMQKSVGGWIPPLGSLRVKCHNAVLYSPLLAFRSIASFVLPFFWFHISRRCMFLGVALILHPMHVSKVLQPLVPCSVFSLLSYILYFS